MGLGVPLGVFNMENAPQQVDLVSTKWITFVDAYVAAILRLQYFYPDAQIIAMLPTYTVEYYTEETLHYFNEEMMEICGYYGIPWVDLRDCGITTELLPDGIHPNAEGMDYITAAVQEVLLAVVEE